MRVVAVHLLNDYSGSPKVLMQLLKVWTKNNLETHLFVCDEKEGFLSHLQSVKYHKFWYRFNKKPILRLLFFGGSQLVLAFWLLWFLRKRDIVYINTVLPFGAAIAAKIKGCKVVYHIHETSVKPKILKRFLFGVVRYFADKVVYVSKYLAEKEPLSKNAEILYNVLEQDFINQAEEKRNALSYHAKVLMICSLKKYKGVDRYVELAKLNPQLTFQLVLNATGREIQSYFYKTDLPENLFLYPTQKNTVPLYRGASVILNLSNTKTWVETFGLTVLEGMAFGLPAIVPPVGGITELVDEGVNGFLVDSQNITELSVRLNELLKDEVQYQKFSKASLDKSRQFSINVFEEKALKIISKF